MLAVRVPPSACSTSQSMLIWGAAGGAHRLAPEHRGQGLMAKSVARDKAGLRRPGQGQALGSIRPSPRMFEMAGPQHGKIILWCAGNEPACVDPAGCNS